MEITLTLRAHKVLPGKAWVARLAKEGSKISREFLEPDRDERSRAGSGNLYFDLEDGLYETSQVTSSTHGEYRRDFLQVSLGKITRLNRDQVYELLGFRVGLDLPELKGSPKQVAWVEEQIRPELLDLFASAAEKNPDLAPYLDRLRAVRSAKWWIDQRTTKSPQQLLGRLMDAED